MQTFMWIVLLIAAFVAGFFVGKRHGQRVEKAAAQLKDTVGKL